MAFDNKATVVGCPISYQVGENAKKYTFKDLGFVETKNGNLQYNRPLDTTVQDTQGFKLKITVAADLKTLKMSITTANGMKAVNIFNGDKYQAHQDNFYFIMDEMIKRECLVKA